MRLIYLSILLLISLFAGSQVYSDRQLNDTLDQPASHTMNQQNKLKFSMELGTYFGIANGYGNYFGTYVSPRIQYPLSKRFTASAGMMITGSTGGARYSPFENSFYSGGYTGSLVFIEGAYKVNENLTLTGATFREIEFRPVNTAGNLSPVHTNNNYKGIIMGADYKLGENVFIRGQIEISNGRNPYYHSPMITPASHSFFNPFSY